jgi:hypothetical protein
MKYKLAFELVKNIHEQNGDHTGFRNLKGLLDETIPKFKTFKDWEYGIKSMSSKSDDDVWSMQEFDESVKVIYKLMGLK